MIERTIEIEEDGIRYEIVLQEISRKQLSEVDRINVVLGKYVPKKEARRIVEELISENLI